MPPIRVKLPWHRRLGQQAVSGAKLQVPFSIMGKAMESLTPVPPDGPLPQAMLPAPPQYMQAYAAALTPERTLAFEAGVDLFCKDAGFDAEDTAAMYELFKRAGWVTGLMKARHALKPVMGQRLSRWAVTKPIQAAKATPGIAANIGGMMGMDWAFNKALGGGAEEVAQQAVGPVMDPRAAYPMYPRVQHAGGQPLSLTTPIYRQASLGRTKEAAIPGAVVGKAVGKTALRGVPVIGTAMSGLSAVQNALQGNWGRAALDVGAAGASLIPGVGTAASLGLAGASSALDVAEMARRKPMTQGPVLPGRPRSPRPMSLTTPITRHASVEPGMTESMLYRTAALEGLKRVSSGQLKQAADWEWGDVAQGLMSPIFGGTDWHKNWGEEIRNRREYGIKGPTRRYEETWHPWDRMMNAINIGPTEHEKEQYNQTVELNKAKANVYQAKTPEEKLEALKAVGSAAKTGKGRTNTFADITAAERGMFSDNPAERRFAMRRTRSELGPMGNAAMQRWKGMSPGGSDKGARRPGAGNRQWGGGSTFRPVPGATKTPDVPGT